VECEHEQCIIHDRSTQAGTLVDGQPVTEARLYDGAEIIAGQTQFRVSIETPVGSAAADRSESPDSEAAETNERPSVEMPNDESTPSAADFCQNLDLDDEALALLARDTRQLPEEYLVQLIDRDLFVDAIRFQAQILPKRQAISWALSCVRTIIPDSVPDAEKHEVALDSVQAWMADPNEEHRRSAEEAARTLNYETPAAWVAMAVFWSEGSIAPPETEVVAPADHLTGIAASAAVLLAAAAGPPIEVATKHREFLSRVNQAAPPPTHGSA